METFTVRSVSDRALVAELRQRIDEGESEAIALALEIRADFVLIDDAAGRLVADEVGLRPIGALGVLLRAKRSGLIPRICPLMDRLKAELNFFISSRLYETIRNLAKE